MWKEDDWSPGRGLLCVLVIEGSVLKICLSLICNEGGLPSAAGVGRSRVTCRGTNGAGDELPLFAASPC